MASSSTLNFLVLWIGLTINSCLYSMTLKIRQGVKDSMVNVHTWSTWGWTGSCASCSSSAITVKYGIERTASVRKAYKLCLKGSPWACFTTKTGCCEECPLFLGGFNNHSKRSLRWWFFLPPFSWWCLRTFMAKTEKKIHQTHNLKPWIGDVDFGGKNSPNVFPQSEMKFSMFCWIPGIHHSMNQKVMFLSLC